MGKLKITGKELRTLGYPQGPVISIAMNVMEKNFKWHDKEKAFEILRQVLQSPQDYTADPVLGLIAKQLMPVPAPEMQHVDLQKQGIPVNIFGGEQIGEGALQQMHQAARLPIAVAGALMPDAHSGYGLPIGGVLATENAVIPYGVGVDIGCRMCLSIFNIHPEELKQKENFFIRALLESTLFGAGAQFEQATDHEVMENALFDELPFLKGLQDRARRQLGTSGSGNHFAEFGVVEIPKADETIGIEPGNYVGFLTHSGSRALGANIAHHYTKIAIDKRRLPAEAKNLAWLSLDEEEGIEYWKAMNLAGDYASACHHIMHDKIAKQLGQQPIMRIENHHNFAWKEKWEGKEVIVHRKGATPAGKNVLGIIPGSMTAPGFIVKGKGEAASLSSAAHGAGRKMSRSKAIAEISDKEFKEELKRHDVVLLGGGKDESPFAYKDIETVMQSQKALVEVVGKFIPRIVRMDGAAPKNWQKKNGEEAEGE